MKKDNPQKAHIAGRFTASLHSNANGKDNHIDLFFDVDLKEMVYHFFLPIDTFHEQINKTQENTVVLEFSAGFMHKKKYMEYEGEISDNRGNLKILKKGKFSILFSVLDKYPAKKVKILWKK